MRVLLSIRPQHVENIFFGLKTFEFRRKIFARREITTVLIYATKPIGQFVGEFDIAEILEDEPEALWHATRDGSGISKGYYDSYFAGRKRAYALQIANLRVFENPVTPCDVIEDFTPPQSFMYVAGTGPDIRRREGVRLL